jgi:hypothetical protein
MPDESEGRHITTAFTSQEPKDRARLGRRQRVTFRS